MTPAVKITLHGPPVGKGRPRFRVARTASGKQFVSAYTDAQTRRYEADLAAEAYKVMGGIPPLDEALAVEVMAYMPVPESWSGRKKDMALAGEIVPTGRPDIDNIFKCVDSLNKIVWRDDSLIVDIHVWKFFSVEPRLIIEVRPWVGALLSAAHTTSL